MAFDKKKLTQHTLMISNESTSYLSSSCFVKCPFWPNRRLINLLNLPGLHVAHLANNLSISLWFLLEQEFFWRGKKFVNSFQWFHISRIEIKIVKLRMMHSKLEKRETFSLNILYFEEKYSVKLTYSGFLYQIKWFHENFKKNVTFSVSDAKFTLTWKKFRENNFYKNVDFTKVLRKNVERKFP